MSPLPVQQEESMLPKVRPHVFNYQMADFIGLLLMLTMIIISSIMLYLLHNKTMHLEERVQNLHQKTNALQQNIKQLRLLQPKLTHAQKYWQYWQSAGFYGLERYVDWDEIMIEISEKQQSAKKPRWKFDDNRAVSIVVGEQHSDTTNHSINKENHEALTLNRIPMHISLPITADHASSREAIALGQLLGIHDSIRHKLSQYGPVVQFRQCHFNQHSNLATRDSDDQSNQWFDCQLDWVHFSNSK